MTLTELPLKRYIDSSYSYDGFGNIIETRTESESSNNIIVNYYYDTLGRLKKETYPYFAGETKKDVVYDYDTLNRIKKITKPDGTSLSNVYDHWNIYSYDENNHRKDYTKDAYGNIIQINEHAEDGIYNTNYEYNSAGNLIKITDDKGNELNYEYDSLGRKTILNDPNMGMWEYEYDENGNLIEQTDNKGNIISMDYDEVNRVTQKTSASGTTSYIYDTNKKGTLYQTQSSYETKTNFYDNRIRLTQEQTTIDGNTYTTLWNYDAMNRVTSKTYPNSEKVNYNYNKAGELESIPGIINGKSYNAFGLTKTRNYANSLTSEFSYDPNSKRLSRIKTADKQDLEYNYDNVGNVIQINDNPKNKTNTYSYDYLDRLKVAERISDYLVSYNYSPSSYEISEQKEPEISLSIKVSTEKDEYSNNEIVNLKQKENYSSPWVKDNHFGNPIYIDNARLYLEKNEKGSYRFKSFKNGNVTKVRLFLSPSDEMGQNMTIRVGIQEDDGTGKPSGIWKGVNNMAYNYLSNITRYDWTVIELNEKAHFEEGETYHIITEFLDEEGNESNTLSISAPYLIDGSPKFRPSDGKIDEKYGVLFNNGGSWSEESDKIPTFIIDYEDETYDGQPYEGNVYYAHDIYGNRFRGIQFRQPLTVKVSSVTTTISSGGNERNDNLYLEIRDINNKRISEVGVLAYKDEEIYWPLKKFTYYFTNPISLEKNNYYYLILSSPGSNSSSRYYFKHQIAGIGNLPDMPYSELTYNGTDTHLVYSYNNGSSWYQQKQCDVFFNFSFVEENPPSAITNYGDSIDFYLLMKVQYFEGNTWVDEAIIVDDVSPRTINFNEEIEIGDIWNQNSWDISTGTHENGAYKVYVAATDENNNIIQNTDGSQAIAFYNFNVYNSDFDIQLKKGWNLISMPLIPEDSSTEIIINNILQPTVLWQYNGSGFWSVYDTEAPFPWFNTLNKIDYRNAFWLNSSSDQILKIKGEKIDEYNISLRQGWNMLGYPLLQEKEVQEILSEVNSTLKVIWAYYSETDEWKVYDKETPYPWLNTLTILEPGKGYWVKVSNKCSWTFNGTNFLASQ